MEKVKSVAVAQTLPPFLDRAGIAFRKNDFPQALRLYQAVLRTHITKTQKAAVLLGIGHCFAKLNDPENARKSFEQALVHHPRCLDALIALSIVYINLNTQKSIRCGIKLLSKAHEIDPANPIVLNHLANFFFDQKDYQNVQNFALRALETETAHSSIKAESYYQLGRVFHVRKDFEQAFKYYHQSTQFASSHFILPFFGLGKIYIQKGDFENAAKCFETVLKSKPDDYETMKILASLYANSPDPKKSVVAVEHLNKLIAMRPDDVDAWIELAQISQNKNIGTALYAYRNAVTIIQRDVHGQVPPEILNNIAVLEFRLGDLKAAEESYVESLEISKRKAAHDAHYFAAISVTTNYNLARVYEALRQFNKATNCYNVILRDHPKYLDCYLRLGCMARDRGDFCDASFRFKEALNVDQEHVVAWILIANLHLAKQEFRPAQQIFERILKQIPDGKNDSYSLIALGNIWLGMMHAPVTDKSKSKIYQDRALEMYTHVLKNDPDNAWATNGVGCVLAHKGFLEEAHEVFFLVREAATGFNDARMNLAHLYVYQKQFHLAIQLYEQCLEMRSVDVFLYLGRAYFKSGRFAECKSTLLKARRIFPDDVLLRFNVAAVLEIMAVGVMKDEKAEFSAVLKAVKELGIAEKDFKYLSVHGDPKVFDVARATAASQRCKDVHLRATYYVARACELDKIKTKKRVQQAEKKVKLLEWQKKQDENEEKLKREVRETQAKMKEALRLNQEEMKAKQVLEESSKKSRKRDRVGETEANMTTKRKRIV